MHNIKGYNSPGTYIKLAEKSMSGFNVNIQTLNIMRYSLQ